MNQRLSECESLLHPAGKLSDIAASVCQTNGIESGTDRRFRNPCTAEGSRDRDCGLRIAGKEDGSVGEEAQFAASRRLPKGLSKDSAGAGRGLEESQREMQCGRFASAVGAEESDDLAGLDGKCELVERELARGLAKALRDFVKSEDWGHVSYSFMDAIREGERIAFGDFLLRRIASTMGHRISGKYKAPGKHSRGLRISGPRALVGAQQDDDEGEQYERFHEGQTECQQQQDAGAGAWIACHRFGGRGSGAALSKAGEAGGDAHTEAGCEGGESSTESDR